MGFEDLTSEQMERLKACKTPEEILALAREEGYELSDEELEAVGGGRSWFDSTCDKHECRAVYVHCEQQDFRRHRAF